MNWDDYDLFCHVIEHRGFSAAARALNCPKSTVSAAVSRLESALGVRLLERTTRQVRPTEFGQGLYQSIGILFAGLREARAEAFAQGAQGAAVTGTLRITGPHEFSTFQLGPVICSLLASHPQLTVCLDVADDTINPVDLRYDIAFTRLDGTQPLASLVQRRVMSFARGVFAAPTLLQTRGVPRTPQDLLGLSLLCATHDNEWVFTALGGATVSVSTLAARLRSSNTAVRRQAAVAGRGVAQLPVFYAEDAVQNGQLLRLVPDYTCAPLQIYAILASKSQMPAKVRLFLDALARHVGAAGELAAVATRAPSPV